MTMTHIETIELGASAATVTFSGISQDFTDLLIKVSARSTRTGQATDILLLKPNGSAASFSALFFYGTGTTSTSTTVTTGAVGYTPTADVVADTFGNADIYISNYTVNGNIAISVDGVTEDNATAARQFLISALSTAGTAISSIELDLNSADFTANSTFSLYGIS